MKADVDADIHHRLRCTSTAFGRLRNRRSRPQTWHMVYWAAVNPALLFTSGTWTSSSRHLMVLERSLPHCPHNLLPVHWKGQWALPDPPPPALRPQLHPVTSMAPTTWFSSPTPHSRTHTLFRAPPGEQVTGRTEGTTRDVQSPGEGTQHPHPPLGSRAHVEGTLGMGWGTWSCGSGAHTGPV